MKLKTPEEILNNITRYYLASDDFNGISVKNLLLDFNNNIEALKKCLHKLLIDDKIGLIDSQTDINPHIIRVGFQPKDKQIEYLKNLKNNDQLYHTCVYPTKQHLENTIDKTKFLNEPYKLCLALGEAQLDYHCFDLTVLEFYRNDPRYYYLNRDISGYICIHDEYFESPDVPEKDQILLESFGFAYDENLNRAVAVFTRYLSNLSSEHQQIWKAKELEKKFKLHPDYFRSSIIGDWPEREPIFTAFLAEMFIINKMSIAMGKPKLFKNDYGEYGSKKPPEFSFLVRPTLDEYNKFIHLLDKLLSENINFDFFKRDIELEEKIQRKDGKVQVINKNSLRIFDEWIRKYFKTDDWDPWDKSIESLKKIRKLRQKPAHSVSENVFDQKYFKEQRELMIEAYGAIRTIRLMFANHPNVRESNLNIPDWLVEGKIWTQ